MENHLSNHLIGGPTTYSKMQRLLHTSPDVICTIDASGKFVEVSRASKQLWGYAPQELIGKYYMDMVIPEDLDATIKVAQEVMDGRDITFFENRHICKNGSVVPMVWSAHWDSKAQIFFCIARDASEKKKREELHARYEREVKKQNQQMKSMLERITDGFFALDSSFTITYWNKASEIILGRKKEDVLSLKIQEVFPGIEETIFFNNYHKALAQQVSLEFESYFQPMKAWYEVRVHPSEEGLSVFFRDVTIQKKLDEGRRQQEKQLRNQHLMMSEVLEQMGDGFITLERNGNVVYWNAEEERKSGVPRSWVLGKVLWEVFPMLKETEYYTAFQKVLEDPTPIKKRFFSPFSQKWIDLHAFATTQGVSIFLRDISEQKKAEDEVRKLSLVAKEAYNAVWMMDAQKKITWINEAFSKTFGYTLKEVIGKSPADVMSGPETSQETLNQLLECWQKKKPFSGEIINYTKDGDKIYAHITSQPILDEEGNVENYFTVQTDISELKKMQEALLQSNERFNLASKSSAIYDWDIGRNNLQWGHGLWEIFGYHSEELQMGQWEEKLHPADRAGLVENLNQTLYDPTKMSWTVDYRLQKPNGVYAFVFERGFIVRDEAGKAIRMVGILEDITDRKQLEEQLLIQQKKMNIAVTEAQEKERAEVGLELHDNVNQVLTTVKLYTELCLDGVGNSREMLTKCVNLLQGSINEIRGLSKRLSAPTLGNIRLKDSVKELIEAVKATGKVAITLDIQMPDALEVAPPLHLALYRILQEHMTNILKHAQAQQVGVVLQQKANCLHLYVNDDGKGFDTNSRGGGIGITNMQSRAESAKGTFLILSAPGKGCKLLVRLPIS